MLDDEIEVLRGYARRSAADGPLLRMPVLKLLSGTWEIVAQKTEAPALTRDGSLQAERELVTAEA